MKRTMTIFMWALIISVSVLSGQGNAAYSPHGMAATSDGRYLYVANTGQNSVSVIDTSYGYGVSIKEISVGNAPWDVAISPDDAYACVTDASDDTVSVISISSNTVSRTVSLGAGTKTPRGIAIVGDYAYVANEAGESISIIEVASGGVVYEEMINFRVFDVEGGPGGDGNSYLYVTLPATFISSLVVYTIQSNGLLTSYPTFDTEKSSHGVAIKPDSRHVYVANTGSGTVSMLDTSIFFTTPTNIPVGNSPNGVAVSADGTHVYVTNTDDDSISVIDTSTDTVSQTITGVGSKPYGIVSVNPVYVANSGDDTVTGIDTTLDPMASVWFADVAATPDSTSDSTSEGGGGGGGGGCSLNKNADFSPELLILLLVSVVYLSRRKQRKG